MNRIIGKFDHGIRGPLIFAFGGIHGNELAGIQAITYMLKMLEVEPITNPDFTFSGRFIGLRGNIEAIKAGKRFINKDLNRAWNPQEIKSLNGNSKGEDKEIQEILKIIDREIENYKPGKLVILDLHTTTATGGIFAIPSFNACSMDIALKLNVPVIDGLIQEISGTTLHYFTTENFNVPVCAITFESGQHKEKLSVNRAIAALTNLLHIIGCYDIKWIDNIHNHLLTTYSEGLPKLSKLLYTHRIKAEDKFVMKAGFVNFQPIAKGELLAHDRHGNIYSKFDGLLLMPLYQKQGNDGFFIVKKVRISGV